MARKYYNEYRSTDPKPHFQVKVAEVKETVKVAAERISRVAKAVGELGVMAVDIGLSYAHDLVRKTETPESSQNYIAQEREAHDRTEEV